MKTFFKTVVAILLVSLSSCSKDSDSNSTPLNPGGTLPAGTFIRAKVNETSFSSNIFGVESATANNVGTGVDRVIQILGTNLSSNSISINLVGINTVGTYTLNPDSNSVVSYNTASPSVVYGTGICAGATGTVTITAISDTKVEGTFSFTGKNGENCTDPAKTITEGQFRGVF